MLDRLCSKYPMAQFLSGNEFLVRVEGLVSESFSSLLILKWLAFVLFTLTGYKCVGGSSLFTRPLVTQNIRNFLLGHVRDF